MHKSNNGQQTTPTIQVDEKQAFHDNHKRDFAGIKVALYSTRQRWCSAFHRFWLPILTFSKTVSMLEWPLEWKSWKQMSIIDVFYLQASRDSRPQSVRSSFNSKANQTHISRHTKELPISESVNNFTVIIHVQTFFYRIHDVKSRV